MKPSSFISIILLFLSTSAYSQAFNQFRIKAESAVYEDTTGDGAFLRKTVNQRFDFTSVYLNGEREIDLLIVQTFEQTFRSDQDGSQSSIILSALRSGKRQYDTTLWTLSYPADEGELWSDAYYRMITYGCCSAEDVITLFRIDSGKLVVESTSEPIFVEVPNKGIKRIISYLSAYAMIGFEGYSDSTMAVLTLASDEQIIDRVLVLSDEALGHFTPDIALISKQEPLGETSRLVLENTNENDSTNAVSGFQVKMQFAGDFEATVPVNQDRFDLTAVSPKAKNRFQMVRRLH